MTLEGATNNDIAAREQALITKIEALGGKAGNTTLMRELSWNDETYWPIRNRLVDQGRLELGRGKGGSVKLVAAPVSPSKPDDGEASSRSSAPSTRASEQELYEPVADVLRVSWAKDKRYRELVLEVTARQGKRDTGGKWTRPDITVATMTTLVFVPGKVFDVTTFEIKPSDALDVTAVYEALAHRRAASRAYVWLHLPEAERADRDDAVTAIVAEAKRHGIGVIAGSDPKDYDTWEELVEAVRVEPDPHKINDFITVQFSAGNKDELLKWMR